MGSYVRQGLMMSATGFRGHPFNAIPSMRMRVRNSKRSSGKKEGVAVVTSEPLLDEEPIAGNARIPRTAERWLAPSRRGGEEGVYSGVFRDVLQSLFFS